MSILNQNVSTMDTFWFNLPKKQGRSSKNFGLKIKKKLDCPKFYDLQKSMIRGEEKNLYHIFDPTLEGIWTSSKRCSRNFFSSLAYELNYYWILRILKLWENSFFGIFKSKLLLSLPHFLGILNHSVRVTWYLLANTYYLILVPWYLLSDQCYPIFVTWYILP